MTVADPANIGQVVGPLAVVASLGRESHDRGSNRTPPWTLPAMFSHIFTSVSDFERALTFYSSVLNAIGIEARFLDRAVPWAGWHSEGNARPYFVICKPFDGRAHDPGNGQMVAFAAKDRATVRLAYETALSLGAKCEGPLGLTRGHCDQHKRISTVLRSMPENRGLDHAGS